MEQIFSPESLKVAAVVLAKAGIAVFLGGAIGLERERHGRPAGLRTHMLVALGVVLFSIISTAYKGSDPTRISAQVVTGIGFLGAGTILRLGGQVMGLTSAASIWATSAIAMAVARGGPYLLVAGACTFMALITLTYVERIERKYRPKSVPVEMMVVLNNRADLHDLLQKLKYDGFDVKSIRMISADPRIEVAIQVSGGGDTVLLTAGSIPGVIEAKLNGGV